MSLALGEAAPASSLRRTSDVTSSSNHNDHHRPTTEQGTEDDDNKHKKLPATSTTLTTTTTTPANSRALRKKPSSQQLLPGARMAKNKKRSTSFVVSWMLSLAVAFSLFTTFTYQPPHHLDSSDNHHHPAKLLQQQPPLQPKQQPTSPQQERKMQQQQQSPPKEESKGTAGGGGGVAALTRKQQDVPAAAADAAVSFGNTTTNQKETPKIIPPPPPSVSMRNGTLVSVLQEAGVYSSLSPSELQSLPSLERTFDDLYGRFPSDDKQQDDGPVIYGLETCERYRQLVPHLRDRYTAPAGMFNTGTNNLQITLQKNLDHASHVKALYQVPWGKHRMEARRLHHQAPGAQKLDQTKCLPIVIVRDPYHWMQSMCKSPYSAHWKHGPNRCPNLVSSIQDRKKWSNIIWDKEQLHSNKDAKQQDQAQSERKADEEEEDDEDSVSFQVKIIFDKDDLEYFDSLVDLWNDWYRPYWKNQGNYPRLIVRFEDMLLYAPKIIQAVSQCMGIPQSSSNKTPFQYQTNTAKGHGSGTNFLKAILKTADADKRSNGLTLKDKIYAAQHLDPELMKAFQYRIVED